MTDDIDDNKISITFKPAEPCLEKFFGKLEAKVIDIVWEHTPVTIKRVLYFLNTDSDHEYAYTTIMTVMNRLVKKNILKRIKKGHSFVYEALISKDDFLDQAIDLIIESLHTNYPDFTNKAIKKLKK